MRIRREKRERLLAEGAIHTRCRCRAPTRWPRSGPRIRILAPTPPPVTQVGVTGRVIFMRNTGKLCFATLQEGDGTELQAMISLDKVGEDALAAWKADVDLGDLVSCTAR